MFFAHSCDGCSSGPLTQYKNNDIYRELIEEDKYFSNEGDERRKYEKKQRIHR